MYIIFINAIIQSIIKESINMKKKESFGYIMIHKAVGYIMFDIMFIISEEDHLCRGLM